jgi:ring-1,2-phenylacetyl-CoA epoxidase subunit PaaC
VNALAPPSSLFDTALAFADDELVLGWRDSEWTGVAPFLEEDVAFSSIAQGEIGHARGALRARRRRARRRR